MGDGGRIDGFIAQLETYKLDAMQAYRFFVQQKNANKQEYATKSELTAISRSMWYIETRFLQETGFLLL